MMRRAQGTLVLGALLFIVLLFVLVGIYIKLLDSLADVGNAIKRMCLRESLRSRENIVVVLKASTLRNTSSSTKLNAVLLVTNTGSISTRIQYTILACYTSSGIAKAVLMTSECAFTLAPGESRTCNINYRFPMGCGYATVTLVTAFGKSYTVRIG